MTEDDMLMIGAADRLTLSLPAHWLPAIICGSTDTLIESEARAFNRWDADMRKEFRSYTVTDMSRLTRRADYHDAAEYGVAACQCHDVEFALPTWEE